MLAKNVTQRVLMIALVVGALVPAGSSSSAQPDAVATLTPLQGLVQRRADSDPDYVWQNIAEERLLFEGDWVQTDHLGLAEVVFFDGNLVEVLPDSLFQVKEYAFVDADSPVVTINLSVGDLHHQIEQRLDDASRYEIDTPSAVLSVRGTSFFSSVTPLGETILNHETGNLAISGIMADGTTGPTLIITGELSLAVSPDGELGEPAPYNPPEYPPPAPLAPLSCGNAICEPGENPDCALDCQMSATCGNGICEPASLEGPVTCRVDCVPVRQPKPSEANLVVPPTTIPLMPAATSSTGQSCTVLDTTGSVVVYVGPGFDRGRRMYLPTNIAIPVVGAFTDGAGNLWWNVLPPDYIQSEPDRYWIVAAAVTGTGDCAHVPPGTPPSMTVPGYTPPNTSPVLPPDTISPSTGDVQPAPIQLPDQPLSVSFYADRDTINPRRQECATITWSVTGVREVYYEGQGVTGQGSRVECPLQTTTYTLRVVLVDGSVESYTGTITTASATTN